MRGKNIRLESGKEYTLSQLLSGHNRIIIPDLQRDYCWGDKAWNKDENNYTELVSGFVENLISSFSENPNDKLTLGLIYGYENPRFHIQLCDGQQRFTTLFILLGMINRKVDNTFQKFLISDHELNHDDKEPYLQYAIRESTLYFLSDLVCEFFLNKSITAQEIKNRNWYFGEYDLDASIQSILSAIQIMENSLSTKGDDFNYIDFGNFILDNLQMLYYDMGTRTRGEETFVVINTTGEPLTATENLKPILIGNILDESERKVVSDQWEEREEWFWQNRTPTSVTADGGLNDFFVWYWQIRLLQEKAWKNKVQKELDPKELFLKKPSVNSDNEENPEIARWDKSVKPETIHAYFIALKKLIEKSKDERVSKVLKTIQNEDISLFWFRKSKSNLEVILPLIAYLVKFKEPTGFYEFVRRIRKNYFDKKSEERKCNYIDWRHIIQIIELSENEENVLLFETKANEARLKKISNVSLNEWYNDEEKKKYQLKKYDQVSVEKWEDHIDFMGDLSFLLSIYSENEAISSPVLIKHLDKYYNNYIQTIDLIRTQESGIETAELSNLFRLFLLFIGSNKVGHMPRVSWEIEGVLFSTINRNHLSNNEFKKLCASDDPKTYCRDYIKKKIQEWDLFNINENNYSTDKTIKCWLTLKAFNAIEKNVCLAYYDGNETGVAAYLDCKKNRIKEDSPFAIENMICGFGVKAGGAGSYVHYTGTEHWLKPHIIDTPFDGISLVKNDRKKEQIEVNKKVIDEIINRIKSGFISTEN